MESTYPCLLTLLLRLARLLSVVLHGSQTKIPGTTGRVQYLQIPCGTRLCFSNCWVSLRLSVCMKWPELEGWGGGVGVLPRSGIPEWATPAGVGGAGWPMKAGDQSACFNPSKIVCSVS
jgi:hypothetical protein